MKKHTVIRFVLATLLFFAGCKKDGDDTSIIIKEDFVAVYKLPGIDWKFISNNTAGIPAEWTQGSTGYKGSSGFPAYSYKNSGDEYAMIYGNYGYVGATIEISGWMITRKVVLRNGDIIRFYTRSASQAGTDRMQLLLSETSDSYDVGNTPTSVGVFTKLLLDINPNQTAGAYPPDWTQQTVTISGLNGATTTRLAFRYVVNGIQSSGVGVDEFSITRN